MLWMPVRLQLLWACRCSSHGCSKWHSTAALILLVCWYVSGVMGDWRPAVTLGVVLGAAYAALYRVLDSEDYALLMGSAMVFTALATLMIATRRLDWSALGRRDA